MKKVISTVTAMAFVLGLAAAGLAQTAGKDVEKPAAGKETPAVQTQAAPVEKQEAGAEKATKLETKSSKQVKEKAQKRVKKSKKTEGMPEQPAAAPTAEPKPEVK
ncbi:MAG: hypothetical protein QME75_08020 [Deltaproteobacteria bacterium]|nr:hypothetical protein [Deltaproteobacteria bacterium]